MGEADLGCGWMVDGGWWVVGCVRVEVGVVGEGCFFICLFVLFSFVFLFSFSLLFYSIFNCFFYSHLLKSMHFSNDLDLFYSIDFFCFIFVFHRLLQHPFLTFYKKFQGISGN